MNDISIHELVSSKIKLGVWIKVSITAACLSKWRDFYQHVQISRVGLSLMGYKGSI